MRFLKQLVPVVLIAFIGGQGVAAVAGNPILTLVGGLVAAVLALLVYAGVVRWAERRTVVELAPRSAAGGLAVGLVIGVGWFAMVIVYISFLE